ncbi:uncharacterized protein LOC114851319 [Betta splendens]|uniref:Uncharacterized protein LOC114851319 n=1 Tax=Betta splendens TaxID=158456 RepID=A0A6P7LVT4_BETSP|nr:uncharacterized protein LOC114851319 [Betta splendens]
MTPADFLFCLTCLFVGELGHTAALKFSTSVFQDTGFKSVKTGENLTLHCFSESDVAARFYWYKQTLGQTLRLISSFYKFDNNATFYNELYNNPRFTLVTDSGKNHLTIADLQVSDSATYYCGSSYSYKFQFADGVTVNVHGADSSIPFLVHQSVSGSIQPGGSVTLNCTVQTGTCDGQHSVYWFKDSVEARPGFIYTHGDRNDQCERKPDTQTHTCVYDLPVNNLSLSHSGTLYCAVASCGHILFGEEPKQSFEDRVPSYDLVVYLLSGALGFTVILSVLLTFLLCKIKETNICQCTASPSKVSTSSTTNSEIQPNKETVHYAAIRQQTTRRSKRQENNCESHCVYSNIKE